MNNVLDHGHLTVKHINNFDDHSDFEIDYAARRKEEPLNYFTNAVLSRMTSDVDQLELNTAISSALDEYKIDDTAKVYNEFVNEQRILDKEIEKQVKLVNERLIALEVANGQLRIMRAQKEIFDRILGKDGG